MWVSWMVCGRADFGRREYGSLRFRRFGRGLDDRLENRSLDLRLRTLAHEGSKCLFLRRLLRFEVKWLRRVTGRHGRGFRMTAAHHRGVEPLLDNGAGAGLDHGLLAQHRSAMRLFVEIGLHPIGLVRAEQARVGMCVGKLQTLATGDDVLEERPTLWPDF